jgi:ATP-dependent RNA helicase RhlE
LLFSATQSEEIKELSDTLLDSPEKLEVHKKNTIVEEINEFSILLKEEEKEQALQFLLTKNKYKSCIIFVKTKDNTELVLGYLQAL